MGTFVRRPDRNQYGQYYHRKGNVLRCTPFNALLQTFYGAALRSLQVSNTFDQGATQPRLPVRVREHAPRLHRQVQAHIRGSTQSALFHGNNCENMGGGAGHRQAKHRGEPTALLLRGSVKRRSGAQRLHQGLRAGVPRAEQRVP